MEAGSDDVVVRDARASDAAGIARVYIETWRAAYAGILPAAYLGDMSLTLHTKSWAKAIRAKELVLVAEADGQVVGFSSGGRETDRDAFFRGEIFTLYVHPSAQRRGIGAELLVEMLRSLRDLAPVLVWVLAANEPAQRFYEELGGVPVRRGIASVAGLTLPKIGYAYFDVG